MATKRPAFTYCIHHKAERDIRVLHGNRIVSRHASEAGARAALDAIFRKPRTRSNGLCQATDSPRHAE